MDGAPDTDGLLLRLGAVEGRLDGACDIVGGGGTVGAILTLGLREAEGTDEREGLNDVVGFREAKFDGALLVLGLFEANAEGFIEGCCDTVVFAIGAALGEFEKVALGAFDTVGLDGLDEAVGAVLGTST